MIKAILRITIASVAFFVLCFSVFRSSVSAAPNGQKTVTTPILVVYDQTSSNSFYPYIGEILRTEGILSFTTVEVGSLPADLNQYSLIILAEADTVSSSVATSLTAFVSDGGALLAMRPPSNLDSLFGVTTVAGTVSEGYIKMDVAHVVNTGLTQRSIQYHGAASQYTLNGSSSLAALYSNATTDSTYEAVTVYENGQGFTSLFSYDLAKSIAYTRQGNPAYIDQDSNSDGNMRPTDLFYNPVGGAAYADLTRINIPQADEQMKMFSNLIYYLLEQVRAPVPKTWYFPNNEETLIISTGDDHALSQDYVTDKFNSIAGYGGTSTVYLQTPDLAPTSGIVTTWRAAGHEVSVRPVYTPYGSQASITDILSAQMISEALASFTTKYGSSASKTIRNDLTAWTGWADMAENEANNGFEMDLNYYPCCQYESSKFPMNMFTGSGLPMKFIKEDGTLLNIYQQQTHISDEVWGTFSGSQPQHVQSMLFDVMQTFNVPLSWHTQVSAYPTSYDIGLMDLAQTYSVGVRSAENWLNFWKTRNAITYTNYAFNQRTGVLSYTITIPGTLPTGDQITQYVPTYIRNAQLASLTVDGSAPTSQTSTIRGRSYIQFNLDDGNSYDVVATYTVTSIDEKGDYTHQVETDFTGTFTNTTYIHTDTPGIELTPDFYDDFESNTFDTGKWVGHNWTNANAYTPVVSGGVMDLEDPTSLGVAVRSVSTYANKKMEASLWYDKGDHLNAGLATEAFSGDFASLNVAGSDNFNSWVYYAGVGARVPEPVVSFAAFHHYILDTTGSNVTFTIDDELIQTENVTSATPMHVYFSNSSFSSTVHVYVDWVKLDSYTQTTGTYQSETLDFGAASIPDNLRVYFTASVPAGTQLQVQTRTSTDGNTWSDWSTAVTTSGAQTNSTGRRYAQYLVTFTGTASSSPVLHSIEVKGIDATPPVISSIVSTPTSSGITLGWNSSDASTGVVEYGLTDSYGTTITEDEWPRTTAHSVSVPSLVACATYQAKLVSVDGGLQTGESSNQSVTTQGCTADASIVSQGESFITSSGGTLTLEDSSVGIELTVPASFGASSASFQAKQLDDTTVLASTSTPSTYSLVGDLLYELLALTDVSTPLTSFSQSITLTYAYAPADIVGLDPTSLVVSRWDGASWNNLTDCVVDTTANTVTCTTTQFSVFGLFGKTAQSSSTVSSSSGSTQTATNTAPVCSASPASSEAVRTYAATPIDSSSIMVYFTDAREPYTHYSLVFGEKSKEYTYGSVNIGGRGIRTYVIKDLRPETTYYFSIAGNNDCSPGPWSNELSATTLPLVTTNTYTVHVESPQTSVVEVPESLCTTYTVKKGDSLWSIAQEVLGDGAKRDEIIEENKEKYPGISTGVLYAGWELSLHCGGQEQLGEIPPEEGVQESYSLSIQLLDSARQPLPGVEVTLHSTVQKAVSDELGVVSFVNVEPGDHTLVYQHDTVSGKQSLNVSGDTQHIELTVTLEEKPFSIATSLLLVLLGVVLGMILMAYVYARLRSSSSLVRGIHILAKKRVFKKSS